MLHIVGRSALTFAVNIFFRRSFRLDKDWLQLLLLIGLTIVARNEVVVSAVAYLVVLTSLGAVKVIAVERMARVSFLLPNWDSQV